MEYGGCLPSEDLWTTFKEECDASLLVYNFDYHESRLYRTHFPTKLSEYAWLGMPMVMVGPEYATGIIWGLEHPQAALVEFSAGLENLPARLNQLIGDAALRFNLAGGAAGIAQQDFDPQSIKRRFHEILMQPSDAKNAFHRNQIP